MADENIPEEEQNQESDEFGTAEASDGDFGALTGGSGEDEGGLGNLPPLSDFESLISADRMSGGRITAEATTGPASGPRPASSTPAIRLKPSALAWCSCRSIPSMRLLACLSARCLDSSRLSSCCVPARSSSLSASSNPSG